MSWRAGRCLPLSSHLAPGKGPAGRLLGFGGTVKRGRGEGTEPGAAPETCPSEESQAAARSAQPRHCCLALSGTSAPGLPRRGPGRAASQRGTGPAVASHGVGAGPCLALTQCRASGGVRSQDPHPRGRQVQAGGPKPRAPAPAGAEVTPEAPGADSAPRGQRRGRAGEATGPGAADNEATVPGQAAPDRSSARRTGTRAWGAAGGAWD